MGDQSNFGNQGSAGTGGGRIDQNQRNPDQQREGNVPLDQQRNQQAGQQSDANRGGANGSQSNSADQGGTDTGGLGGSNQARQADDQR